MPTVSALHRLQAGSYQKNEGRAQRVTPIEDTPLLAPRWLRVIRGVSELIAHGRHAETV
jgi:hypothetical protein